MSPIHPLACDREENKFTSNCKQESKETHFGERQGGLEAQERMDASHFSSDRVLNGINFTAVGRYQRCSVRIQPV